MCAWEAKRRWRGGKGRDTHNIALQHNYLTNFPPSSTSTSNISSGDCRWQTFYCPKSCMSFYLVWKMSCLLCQNASPPCHSKQQSIHQHHVYRVTPLEPHDHITPDPSVPCVTWHHDPSLKESILLRMDKTSFSIHRSSSPTSEMFTHTYTHTHTHTKTEILENTFNAILGGHPSRASGGIRGHPRSVLRALRGIREMSTCQKPED